MSRGALLRRPLRAGEHTSELRRPLVIWAVVLLAGIGLLLGRFDFGPADGEYATRALVLSIYLWVLLMPTVYYLSRRVLRDATVALVITVAVFLVTTVPWKLVGLDRFFYYEDRPRTFGPGDGPNPPSLEFFPDGALRTFPYDSIFMPLLLATGIAAIWLVWWSRTRAGATAAKTIPWLLTAAFVAICAQSYLHTSMRSPYSYLSYFQAPQEQQHWWFVYHFRDGTGASQGDQAAFTPLEQYFQGVAPEGSNMLVRRPFSYYVTAQVSFFINSYYVWLGFNCLFWLVTVAAAGRWMSRVASPRVGVIGGALVTVAPGFLAFVGTTAMYMQAFAAVMIVICLFEELVVRSGGRRWGDILLFVGATSLCALTYDLLPLMVSLLVYGLARKVRAGPLVAALVVVLVIARGFTFLVTGPLGVEFDTTNARQVDVGVEAAKQLLLHPTLYGIYERIVDLLSTFSRQMLVAFFVLPTLLAIAGIPRLKDRALQLFAATMLVTAFGVMAVMEFSNGITWGFIGDAPRLLFPIFPVVFLLAALALDATKLPGRRLRGAAPWIVVAVMAVLVNVDLFGYPTLYVEFFVNQQPVFLPK